MFQPHQARKVCLFGLFVSDKETKFYNIVSCSLTSLAGTSNDGDEQQSSKCWCRILIPMAFGIMAFIHWHLLFLAFLKCQ
jgi:hypothetical protein